MRLAIFDMGGVVVNDVALITPMCAKLGISKDEFFKFAVGSPSGTGTEYCLYAQGLMAGVQMGLFSSKEFWDIFSSRSDIKVAENYWKTLFRPVMNPQTVHIIEQLKQKRIPVVCGTNTLDVHYEFHLREGQYRVFDRVYASHLMGVIKPFADFWYMIRDAEGARMRSAGEPDLLCADILFVDDNPDNVNAASRAGLQAVQFTDAASLAQKLDITLP